MPSGIYKGNKGRIPWNKGLKGWNCGKKNPFFGKKHTVESLFKISKALKGRVQNQEEIEKRRKSLPKGVMHHRWKIKGVGYRALHIWVENKLGKPSFCEFCHTTGLKGRKIHWANKSHEYKRELGDWIRLCAKCHKAYDKTENQIVNI